MKSVLLAALAAVLLAMLAQAGARTDAWPLHIGSRGPRVAAVQWLLSGHCPNKFAPRCGGKVKPTLGTYTKGIYGTKTLAAARAMKYRLGWPDPYWRDGKTGPYFIEIMEGKRTRPIKWVALAQQRLLLVEPGISPMATKIKALAISQLGVSEYPSNSNRGPCISYPCSRNTPRPSYQASTGQYNVAWCASWIQWLLWQTGYGRIADRTAGVLYLETWARWHNFLSAKPHVGSLVTYLDDGGHVGVIMRVTASGYVEASGNSHNAVRETWHPWNYRLRVFINLPGI